MDETASQKSSAAAMEAALIAAGPCNGFKSLHTLSDVKSEGEDMPNLANKADLEEWTTWLTECKNHWEELLASCKASLAELKRNVKASLPAAGKAKAKASAAKKKGKGAGKNKGQEDIYVALSMEAFSDVPKCDASVEMAVAQLGAPVFGDGLDLPMPEKVLRRVPAKGKDPRRVPDPDDQTADTLDFWSANSISSNAPFSSH